MGRIRTIKPELAKHETLFDAEAETGLPLRFAWVMLFTVCDREGRFPWRPRSLKPDVLPYDDCNFSDVLDALESRGLIERYTVDGKDYGHIPTWKKHQAVNAREAKSTIPSPEQCTVMHVQTPEEYVQERGVPCGVNVPSPLRRAVFHRDGNECVRCGSVNDLTIDHIFPQSFGGTHTPQNLRTLCKSCNSARPVSGEALQDDLALDGLTLEDRERICMHVHARGEGKGREGKGTRVNGAFHPPTPDDVREYVKSRGCHVDPDKFHDFYTAKGWMVGKNKMKDWQAAVRTWEREDAKRGGDDSWLPD